MARIKQYFAYIIEFIPLVLFELIVSHILPAV